MFTKCIFVCLMGVLVCEINSAAVSFITPCKAGDNKCLVSSIQKAIPYLSAGVPDLGLVSLDPLDIGDINADDGDLKLRFKNMKIAGPSKCKVSEAERDAEKNTIKLVIECPIDATGQYELNGKLLFLEATGDGGFEIKTNKAIINAVLKLKNLEKGGKKYWKISGFDYTYDIVEKAEIRLDNLFGGDATRAKPIVELLNHSWKELISEVGQPIIKQLITKACEHVNKFFILFPVDDLELS